MEDLRETLHTRFKERVFGQFQELCERIVNNAFIETIDKYTKSSKLVQEKKMPFQDFVPENSDMPKGGEGAGFSDFIPDDAPKPEITSGEQEERPEVEEKPKAEVSDEDLEDMGIPKEKIEEFREKGAEEKVEKATGNKKTK